MDGIQQAPRMAGSSEGCDRNSASEKIHFSEGRLIQRSKPRSKNQSPKKHKNNPKPKAKKKTLPQQRKSPLKQIKKPQLNSATIATKADKTASSPPSSMEFTYSLILSIQG